MTVANSAPVFTHELPGPQRRRSATRRASMPTRPTPTATRSPTAPPACPPACRSRPPPASSAARSAAPAGPHSVTITVSDGSRQRDRHVHLDGHSAGQHGAGRRLGRRSRPAAPTTGQTLTANVTSHDAEGDTLTTSYQWTRNGTDIAGATGATLNLATAGNGDQRRPDPRARHRQRRQPTSPR